MVLNEAHSQIKILPFHPDDQDEVKGLILSGLKDHWGSIDFTKNFDLNDIFENYKEDVFLIASIEGKIIGTGALVRRPNECAEIVRMYVLKKFRRSGIGKRILNQLVDTARNLGCKQIILETTETWEDVIAFYLDYGFRITHYEDGDVYFILNLDD